MQLKLIKLLLKAEFFVLFSEVYTSSAIYSLLQSGMYLNTTETKQSTLIMIHNCSDKI